MDMEIPSIASRAAKINTGRQQQVGSREGEGVLVEHEVSAGCSALPAPTLTSATVRHTSGDDVLFAARGVRSPERTEKATAPPALSAV